MPLNHSVIKELKRELTDLKRTRGGIDARISALEAILRFDRAGEEAPDTRAIRPPPHSPKRFTSSGRSRARRKRGSFGRKVSAVIQKTPGLLSGGIVQALEQTGFSVSGKTPLRERVYHELRRLVRRGIVRKDKSGAYALAKRGRHEHEGDAADRTEPVEVVAS